MKSTILGLMTVTMMTVASQQSFACRILPSGDSKIRINALHDTLAGSEVLKGFAENSSGEYTLSVYNLQTNTLETRVYRLANTSPMCPVYKAIRVK